MHSSREFYRAPATSGSCIKASEAEKIKRSGLLRLNNNIFPKCQLQKEGNKMITQRTTYMVSLTCDTEYY